MEKAGIVRDGGSFLERVKNIFVLEHADGLRPLT